ncbi:LacI family DNA-binding transcriptional regulator [Bifidobacterium eulemuris]|uniref:LacI family DNA-binding transcriptional regulator n=1 Tax=Bifidobacterium eulemuris TaxID=1765219 RepID=A0A261G555_9BIFI|nr:LacI family DNA-binding transcriptional regulator [Bifidobacterium eulemuris]OZG66538.1 LacI family transcriptional regulator [Bifidobacterium eulemuris]QOL32627.1 LacI family DNA-binding transcriptional regulator [Bifidobacterium eulemuris]
MRVTLKDIAEATGTSVPTVSLILNDKPFRVSEETRRKVLRAAEEMHYVRNQAARDLRQGANHTLGLIVPDISNGFYSSFAKGVERACHDAGWSLLLNDSDNDPSREAEYIELMYSKNVEGVILANAAGDERKTSASLRTLVSRGVPHVLMDLSGTDQSDAVAGDHHVGGRTATDYLLRLGHRRIACITGPMHLEGARSRYEGYREALSAKGVEYDESLVYEGDYTYETALQLARMMDWEAFTAVVSCNDLTALAVCKVAAEMGYSIPADRSVIGYDDVLFAGLMTPGLTTMHQPNEQMGMDAARMLMERVRHPDRERVVTMYTPQLVVRDSTAPCR